MDHLPKYFLLCLITSCFTSCFPSSAPAELNESDRDTLPIKTEESSYSMGIDSWQKAQDSLREVLLNSKPNSVLKSSVFEEPYIRGLIKDSIGKLDFQLNFNLHGLDCGAPDCYYSTIHFSFGHNGKLIVPEKLAFQIEESGCIGVERTDSAIFKLVDSDSNHVNYYCSTEKSNLIFLKTDKQQQFIYYFTQVKPNEIKVSTMNRLLETFEETDSTDTYPFRITTMTVNGYELFLD